MRRSRISYGRYRSPFWERLSSRRRCNLPMLGGSSCISLSRKLSTVRRSRLKSSAGSVVKLLEDRNSFSLGCNGKKASEEVGTRVKALRGRMVALDKLVNDLDLRTC